MTAEPIGSTRRKSRWTGNGWRQSTWSGSIESAAIHRTRPMVAEPCRQLEPRPAIAAREPQRQTSKKPVPNTWNHSERTRLSRMRRSANRWRRGWSASPDSCLFMLFTGYYGRCIKNTYFTMLSLCDLGELLTCFLDGLDLSEASPDPPHYFPSAINLTIYSTCLVTIPIDGYHYVFQVDQYIHT